LGWQDGAVHRLTARRRIFLAGFAIAAVLLAAACTANVGTSESPAPSGSDASADPLPSGRPSASPAASVLAAVEDLIRLDGARVTMAVDRWKGETGPERLISAEGELMPSDERGRVVYDLSALLAIPGSSPSPLDRADLAWDGTTLWVRPFGETADWGEATRAHARENFGLIGRLPDEVLGLARPDGDATRHLVLVPVKLAARHGVPSDTPHAEVVRQVYGLDEIPVEVWVRDGHVVRLRYAFERDKALYGGPDRTQVTYDWAADPGIRIAVPPAD
jgi:hypothetical protein